MADEMQLNLFGDFIAFDDPNSNAIETNQESTHETSDSLPTLEEVSEVDKKSDEKEVTDNVSALPRPAGVFRNHTDDRGNYHITNDDDIGAGGKVAKFEANLAAIKLLKELTEAKRFATPEEQSVLVKYTGWGGLADVFKSNLEGTWLERQTALKDILTEDEYARAQHSTMNAHYTDPLIVESVWDAAIRMGYNGGATLEPATGIGHFFGKRPTGLPIEMHGIELDPTSGHIAQQLYQSANIKISGYEEIKIPENRYNLIISNVPFGDYRPYETKENLTPGLDNSASIHDFYFLKSLHGLREGGLIAFITSRYTLDKEDTTIREKIAAKADFVGAIRLPNNAFKQIANTEVVTDIVFLQKRSKDKEMSELTKKFIQTSTISLTKDDSNIDFSVNQYFIDRPEMIIGEHGIGTMYSGLDYTVNFDGDNLKERLDAAVLSLPENVMNVIIDNNTEVFDDSLKNAFSNINIESIPRGSFFIGDDDRIYSKNLETGIVDTIPEYENEKANKKEIDKIRYFIKIRDCLKQTIDHYYNGQDLNIATDLSNLNSIYDAFQKKYGFLNTPQTKNLFFADPDCALVQSLEKWDSKTKTATKADIFSGLTFYRKETPSFVESPIDALSLSLAKYGNLNISYMESLTGRDRNALIDSLMSSGYIYQDPYDYIKNDKTTYYTADEYLSGNVREKLKLANEAAQKNPALFSRNVSDLSNVIPPELGTEDVAIRLNSPILGEKYVKDFVCDTFKISRNSVNVVHVPLTGKWEIKTPKYFYSIENEETYGTPRIDGVSLVNHIMNGKAVRFFYNSDPNDKNSPPVLDVEATNAAEMKMDAINREFSKWIWKDEERTKDVLQRYNEVYNSNVQRKYTHPDRITNPTAKVYMHGCNFPYPLRPNQADAVWRVLQSKNTMLAHTVGAGKTLEMACSAMELRRLGLRNKPMIVCPDHMIGQWASEFRQAYPTAKLLVADDKNWDKKHRREFMSKIVTGDWDAVIIRSEAFKMIPMSAEYQTEYLNKKIEEYKTAYEIMISENGRKSASVKDLEKAIEKYDIKIKQLMDSTKDDTVVPFDKMGIDHLFVDEADIYKNLEYYTQLQSVRGLGSATGSERALDMHMKVKYIQENDGGITFATGTPISNTLVEAYTMQKFLQPEVLKANGLEAFDEWARQYAESVTQMELNNTGTNYKPVTRFSKIVNVPELVTSLKQTWDIQTAQNLERDGILVPGVNLPHMKTINAAAPSTPLLQSYLKHLEKREKAVSHQQNKKGMDNVLSIMTDGRKAAIDMRYINPFLPDDPNSKLNLAVKIIDDVYKRYQTENYTCAVFFDKSRALDKDGNVLFDGVEDMKTKLIARGVKPEEIGDARACKTFAQRQALFEKVKEGEIRVIFGSTETMGAGTNFQKKLKAIVHVDAPWRPRDIEQQNGRGYRPGNETGELEVYNLVTKGSLDTGLWNVLETKAKSIQQIMDGSDNTTRQIDEDYYGSVKDLSIDNELMKEAMTLDHDLKKLRSYEKSFNNDIAHLHRRIQQLPAEIEIAQNRVADLAHDIEKRAPEEPKGDKFSMVLGNDTFTERKLAGDYIQKEATTIHLQAQAVGKNIEKPIGSFCGFDLVLKSTIASQSIATIIAKGQNTQYSVDIRQDSNSPWICVSLTNSIYKTMDKMYEDAKYHADKLTNQLNEYRSTTNQTFPNEEELRTKEARYAKVMAELANQAQNAPKEEQNPYDISWYNLKEMSPEEIKYSVELFNRSVIEKSFGKQLSTAADIAESVKKTHGIVLPPMIVSQIEKGIESGNLKPNATCNLIEKTVESVKKECYWRTEDLPIGINSIFCKNPSQIAAGDIIVRKKMINNEQVFEATKICSDKKEKLLGSEKSVKAMQTRIEQYAACLSIREKVNNTIALGKNTPAEKTSKRPQKEDVVSMEL